MRVRQWTNTYNASIVMVAMIYYDLLIRYSQATAVTFSFQHFPMQVNGREKGTQKFVLN